MANGSFWFLRSRSPGFTLPMMLVVMAGLGYAATTAHMSTRYRLAREREAELIFRGLAYAQAVKSFYIAENDPTKRRLPRNLEELENDPRFAHRRHIRVLYIDPQTGGKFRVLMDGNGGVKGVASASNSRLFQRTKISDAIPFAAGAERYDQIAFEIDPKLLQHGNETAKQVPSTSLPKRN